MQRQTSGQRQAHRQANILAGWRQTSRLRQADRHGDVYKHKHNVLEYTQTQGSGGSLGERPI